MRNKTKLILVFLLALTLRLAGVASRPIWYDEAFSILFAEQGPAAVLSGTLTPDADSATAEEHPPAFYFTLWGWIQVFGNSLISVRILPILLSLGIVLFIYVIASRLFEPPTALIAAFLAAILPFQIHYGQEIRMYVLLTFWLCLATYAFLKRQWILFSIAAALAQYTHNLAAFYLLPLALSPVFERDWKTLRSLIWAGLAAITIYSPWLYQLPAQISKVTSNFWIEKPGVEKLFTLFLMYLPHLPLPNSLLLPGLLVAMLIVALATYQTYRAYKENSPQANSGLWLAYLSFTPPLLLWLASQVSPIYIERALLPSHSIFCIWLAWSLTQTRIPRVIQGVLAILVITSASMGIYQHITYKGFPYGPYYELSVSIQNKLQPGDAVIHSSKLSYLPTLYYAPTLPQGFIIDPPGSSTDTLAPATREILNLNDYATIEDATANSTRTWLVIYQKSIDEFTSINTTKHPHLEYLDANFTLLAAETREDINLLLYSRKIP